MTSKSLFINLQKEDLKRRIWLVVMGFLVAFLIRPVYLLMSIQDMRNYALPTELINFVNNFFTAYNSANPFFIIILAVFLGISGFSYLFSKKKTDFYHAIPMKREKLFFVYYLNGIYIYLVLYVIIQAMCVVIAGVHGFLTMAILVQILKTFCIESIYFLFMYHTVILAVMLTGNLVVAIAGIGVFSIYAPMLTQMIESYFNTNFVTRYAQASDIFYYLKVDVFSPIVSYISILNLLEDGITVSQNDIIIFLIKSAIITIILLIISVWLYKRRPSEVAERAMAFKETEPVIRILLVIPLALLGGIFFQAINSDLNAWFWFGLIFMGVLAHAAMEAIYRFDFKAVLHHKAQLIFCLVTASLIALSFQLDIFGYDRYLPKESSIVSAAVAFQNIDSDSNGSDFDVVNGKIVQNNRMVQGGYQLEHMELSDISTVYALAEAGVSEVDAEESVPYWSDAYDHGIRYVIKFRLANGKEVCRSYGVGIDTVFPYVKSIYESPEYKANAYSLSGITESNIKQIRRVNVYNNLEDQILTLEKEEIQIFLNIYLKELSQLTIADLQKQGSVLRIEPEIMYKDNYTSSLYGYYVYPSFTETLAQLEKMGLQEKQLVQDIKAEDIKNIEIMGSLDENDDVGGNTDYRGWTYDNEKPEDEEKINELVSLFYPATGSFNNSVLNPIEPNINFDVTFTDASGREGIITMYIPEGKLPAFIEKDFETAESQTEDEFNQRYYRY